MLTKKQDPDLIIGSDSEHCTHEKILHRNRSQVQVSLKVTAQIEHLNITVTLEFFKSLTSFL